MEVLLLLPATNGCDHQRMCLANNKHKLRCMWVDGKPLILFAACCSASVCVKLLLFPLSIVNFISLCFVWLPADFYRHRTVLFHVRFYLLFFLYHSVCQNKGQWSHIICVFGKLLYVSYFCMCSTFVILKTHIAARDYVTCYTAICQFSTSVRCRVAICHMADIQLLHCALINAFVTHPATWFIR